MKVNEFVKEYGWDGAKELLEFGIKPKKTWVGGLCVTFKQQDLRRLVESWELVEKHGGLEKVKQDILISCCFGDNDFFQEVTLKKAVKDVESCQ